MAKVEERPKSHFQLALRHEATGLERLPGMGNMSLPDSVGVEENPSWQRRQTSNRNGPKHPL